MDSCKKEMTSQAPQPSVSAANVAAKPRFSARTTNPLQTGTNQSFEEIQNLSQRLQQLEKEHQPAPPITQTTTGPSQPVAKKSQPGFFSSWKFWLFLILAIIALVLFMYMKSKSGGCKKAKIIEEDEPIVDKPRPKSRTMTHLGGVEDDPDLQPSSMTMPDMEPSIHQKLLQEANKKILEQDRLIQQCRADILKIQTELRHINGFLSKLPPPPPPMAFAGPPRHVPT